MTFKTTTKKSRRRSLNVWVWTKIISINVKLKILCPQIIFLCMKAYKFWSRFVAYILYLCTGALDCFIVWSCINVYPSLDNIFTWGALFSIEWIQENQIIKQFVYKLTMQIRHIVVWLISTIKFRFKYYFTRRRKQCDSTCKASDRLLSMQWKYKIIDCRFVDKTDNVNKH